MLSIHLCLLFHLSLFDRSLASRWSRQTFLEIIVVLSRNLLKVCSNRILPSCTFKGFEGFGDVFLLPWRTERRRRSSIAAESALLLLSSQKSGLAKSCWMSRKALAWLSSLALSSAQSHVVLVVALLDLRCLRAHVASSGTVGARGRKLQREAVLCERACVKPSAQTTSGIQLSLSLLRSMRASSSSSGDLVQCASFPWQLCVDRAKLEAGWVLLCLRILSLRPLMLVRNRCLKLLHWVVLYGNSSLSHPCGGRRSLKRDRSLIATGGKVKAMPRIWLLQPKK